MKKNINISKFVNFLKISEDNSIIPVPDPLDWGVLKAQMAAKQQKLGQDLGMVETPSPKVKQIVINPFEEGWSS